MRLPDLPRAVRALLDRTLPEDWRDDIVRDLEEEWAARRARFGATRATAWLWTQAVAFSVRFLPETLREGLTLFAASPDLTLALRTVRRAPFVAVLTVASLAVGIAGALTGYTVVAGAVLTDLPFEGGDRIQLVEDYNRTRRYSLNVRADEYERRRTRLESFEALAAFAARSVVVGPADGDAAVVRAVLATPNLLGMTGVAPSMGRLPDAGDVQPGAEPVVVLPHRLWQRLLAGVPDPVGRTVEVDGVDRTVVGVMPEGFGFPFAEELWIAIDVRSFDGPLRMIGKLREGVDVRTARAEMAAVARPDPAEASQDDDIVHLITSVTHPVVDDTQLFVVAVPIALLVLLLIVMATNVANLMAARNARRSPELAVRSALGGSRGRIVGQLVAEAGVLVVVASVAGVALSQYGLSLVEARLGDELPFWTDFSLRPGAVALAASLALLATLITGLLPARRAVSSGPGDALRDGGRGAVDVRFGRLTGTLVVVQLAICVGFLSAATLLGQSLVSFGFDRYGLPADETLIAQIYFGFPDEVNDSEAGLSAAERSTLRDRFFAEATQSRSRIAAAALTIPGVRSTAYASRYPGNESERAWLEIEGASEPSARVEVADIGPGYLELLGAEPTSGRDFTAAEHGDGLPAVLVNEPFVRERLGGASAVGRRVRLLTRAEDDPLAEPWATIVGVVPDLGLNPGNPSNAAAVYRPLPDVNVVRLALRGDAEPGAWAPLLLDVVRRVDERATVQWTRTLAGQMAEPVAIFRGLGAVFAVLGSLALFLSAASIHALTACAVERRTHELGIRQALGARSAEIVATVLRRSGVQLAVGTTLGTAIGLGLLRLAEVLPWEVRQANALALLAVVAVLVLSGGAALAQPLRRALSVRPADALRAE